MWPFLEVEPRKYRFRILNGSNARFYRISLSSPSLKFTLIGTDGGLLERKIENVSQITLAPAERVDVIIDFSTHKGQSIILTNDAPAPFPNGDPPSPDLTQIMEFRVKQKLSKPDKSKIPEKLSCLERLDPTDAVTVRKNVLVETTDEFGRLKLLLNNLELGSITYNRNPI